MAIIFSIIIVIYILFPMLSMPFVLIFYFIDNKRNILYSALIALTFGILAFNMIPKYDFDLVRLQKIVENVSSLNILDFFKNINNYDLEIIPMFYSYIISFFNNINYLQFFVITIGYFIIFYIVSDYIKNSKTNNLVIYILVTIFAVLGINVLYFFSGLYCYIAIILFSFVIYMDLVKKKNNKLYILLYIIIPFIHSSLFIPVLSIFIYKRKNKITFINLLLIVLSIILGYSILSILNYYLNFNFISRLLMMFESYTNNDSHYKLLYSGIIFLLEILKIIFVTLVIFANNNIRKKEGINGFILLTEIITFLLMIYSRVSIRYIMIIQLIGIIPIIDYFKESKKNIIYYLLLLVLVIIDVLFIIYFIKTINFLNFGDLFESGLTKNIFKLISNGGAI